MGFSYVGHSLCCDLCDAIGARKVRCPFGNCPAIAACPNCRKTRKDALGHEAHRANGCDVAAAKAVAEEQERVRLIKGGALLSVAAQFCPGDRTHVRVTFESRDGYHDAVMPTAVYDRRIDNPLRLSSLAFYEGIHGAPITTTLVESKRVA